MTGLFELLQSLAGALVGLIAALIEAVVALAGGRRDGDRPGWIRIAAMIVCVAILAGTGYLLWLLFQTFFLIAAVAAFVLVAATAFFS